MDMKNYKTILFQYSEIKNEEDFRKKIGHTSLVISSIVSVEN